MSFENEELTLEDYELAISEEAVAARKRDYKNYKPSTIYKVAITSAKNMKSQFGSAQVEIEVQACDSDGEPVGQKYRQWLTYPVSQKGADPMDAKTIQRLRDEMGQILRAQDPEGFAFFGKIEGKGKQKRYYDKDGNLLTAEAKLLAQKEGNRRLMLAIQERMKDASKWTGPAGYATFVTFKRRNGKQASKFQDFSRNPNPKLPVIVDPTEFYAEG